MARGGAYYRNISKLNVFFGVGSILLALGIVGMIIDDNVREWKKYQREFNRLEVEKTQLELKKETKKIDQKQLDELTHQIEEAGKEIDQKKAEVKVVSKQLKSIEADYYKVNQTLQFAKSRQAVAKYKYEEALHHHNKEEEKQYKEELDREDLLIETTKKELDQLKIDREVEETKLAQFRENQKALEDKVKALGKGKTRLENKLAKIKPGIRSWLLNLPVLDFIAPTRKIEQVVVDDLKENLHFAKVARVDRCMTCHLGIDKEEWKDSPQPFKSHPRLDLFVASDSAHPVDQFGCTVCHKGSGQAVNFYDTAHTPGSEEQKKEWQKKYNWKPQPYVEEKMLPAHLVEASCYQCHHQGGVVEVPEASKLNAGKQLFEEKSCYSCHAVRGYEDFPKKGPDLSMLASKTGEDWIRKWLKAPRTFRPDTNMPQFFDLSNTSTEEDKLKNNAEIEGIAAYLYKNSKPFKKKAKSMPEGNQEKGKELVDNRGCLGCHSVGEWEKPKHGPNLNGIGSKVDPKWLYSWIRNPKHYWEQTRMPSLRLTDQEAADMVAYLMTLKSSSFDQMAVPSASSSVTDELVLERLSSQYGTVIGKQKLDAMSQEEKVLYLGEKAIQYYGCAGCHNIPGFEKAGKIGVELSDIGSRNIHTFDFGNVHVDHTKQAWLKTKLGNPRVFDKGKVKARLEKSKMPHFGFSDEETDQLVTFLMGLQKSHVDVNMTDQLDEREKTIEKGRRMVKDLNCAGCHQIEGKGGEIAEVLPKGMNPPPLIREGEKVWGDWLHGFLKKPSTVRHWLEVRMPTYGLSNSEATDLVKYFKALDKQKFTYRSKDEQIPHPSKEDWEAGKQIFDTFRCLQCHDSTKTEGRNPLELAPDLKLAHDRLKPKWVLKWLVDPQKYYPGTRMPGYWPDLQSPLPDVLGGSAKKQIKAIRAYLLNMDKYEESSDKK